MKKITEDGEIVDLPIELPLFWKTPWNHDRDAESARVALTCKDPSMAQQQFQDQVNLTNIVGQFLQTGGRISDLPLPQQELYRDIQEFVDLQDSMVTQYDVHNAWAKLPVEVRNTLRDPQTFCDYVDHCLETGDLEPLQKLGLAPTPELPKPETPPGDTPTQEAGKPAT